MQVHTTSPYPHDEIYNCSCINCWQPLFYHLPPSVLLLNHYLSVTNHSFIFPVITYHLPFCCSTIIYLLYQPISYTNHSFSQFPWSLRIIIMSIIIYQVHIYFIYFNTIFEAERINGIRCFRHFTLSRHCSRPQSRLCVIYAQNNIVQIEFTFTIIWRYLCYSFFLILWVFQYTWNLLSLIG